MLLKVNWIILFCSWNHGLMAAIDHTHGSYFVFPVPFCDQFHPVDAVVRWKYGARYRTVVTLYGAYKKFIQSMGEEFPQTPLPCTKLSMGKVTRSAAIIAESKEEIMVYVQYKYDNFLVYPVIYLHTKYKVIIPFPATMHKTFLAVTTSRGSVQITVELTSEAKAVVEFNGFNYHPGEIIHVTLGKRDVLMLSCICDLTGTLIESTNKIPIVVVGGAYKDTWEKDVLIEQSLPYGAWGKHIALPIEDWMYNITLKIAGKQDVIDILEISTENSTEIYHKTEKVLNYFVQAEDHVIIHSASPFHVVCLINFGYDMTGLIFSNVVPVEQYPKFLCHSFSSVQGTTCFASVGNLSYFQRLFVDLVVDLTSPWNIAVIRKEGDLAELPEVRQVWSYSQRIVRNGDTILVYSGASRLTRLYDDCIREPPPRIGINDGIDNDCDGIVDEEFTDDEDNDVDERVDEDTSSNFAVCVMDYNYGLKSKPWIFLSTSMIAVLISILSALIGVVLFLGGNLVMVLIQGGHPSRPSRVEPVD